MAMTPAEQAAQKVFTGWMTYRDSLVDRIAAAIEQARREEREAALGYIAEHGVPVTSVEVDRYYRARAQESEG